MGSESGVFGDVERLDTSVQTMATIADNEARKPGRKMLIWIGPGWPWLVGSRYVQSNESRQSYFRSIVQLSKKLREARISLYSIYTLLGTGVVAHAAYAKPVRDPRKADPANLGLQVLATQTGGRVLDPSNDLAGQIENCIADIGTYYTLSFAPPPAAQVDEYHDLKVQASQPGSSVRTYTGYYDQP
jgi:VWFA-related protein